MPGRDMSSSTETIPSYILNDPQAFIRFLQDCYRKRTDVVIPADDCQCLADALRERVREASYAGEDLFS